MKYYRNLALIAYMLVSVMLVTGCSRQDIQGSVVDAFGNGVEGVTVKVLKTTFTATTDQSGEYSLDYVPGTFTLHFSKPGYTSHGLELIIQVKTQFPAEPITMYPIPKGKGVYYLSEKEMIKLPQAQTRINTLSAGSYQNDCVFKSEPIEILPGKAIFIDTSPKKLRPASTDGQVSFAHKGDEAYNIGLYFGSGNLSRSNKSTVDAFYMFNQNYIEEKSIVGVGKEKVVIRILEELQPGKFAWVEGFVNYLGDFIVEDNNTCLPFNVPGNTRTM